MDKILIIDDSEFDRKMISKAILAKRNDVTFIELEAGHLISEITTNDTPTVAIIDIRMPDMDGFEVLKSIRNDPSTANVPVLMISGSEEPEDKEMAKAAGADGYYVKPPSASAYFSLGREIYDRYLSGEPEKTSDV